VENTRKRDTGGVPARRTLFKFGPPKHSSYKHEIIGGGKIRCNVPARTQYV
jgi:hypothetical protein